MANTQQVTSSFVGTTPGAGSPFATIMTGAGFIDFFVTEVNCAVPVRTLGTFSLFYVRIASAPSSGATYNFRVNGANGNQAISAGSSTTGEYIDAVNTDTPTAGQTIDIKYVSSGEPSVYSVVFTANSGTVQRIGGQYGDLDGANVTWAGSTQFFGVGPISNSTTEANVQTQFVHACTLQNLAVVCQSKGRSKADTVTLRKNTGNGNLTVSVTGTGLFEDTTHSDSISAADKIAIGVTTGSGSGSDRITLTSVEESTSDSTQHFISNRSSQNLSGGTTQYSPISGATMTISSIETQAQVQMQNAGTLSNLNVNVSANTATGSTTATVRNTAVDTALTLSISTTATGFFQDSTHTAAVAVNDEYAIKFAAAGTGSISVASTALQMTVSAPFSPDEDLFTVWQQAQFDPQITVWQ